MEYYRTGKQDGEGGALCSASGISDQFSTLNSRQASTSDSQSVAVQSPRHWGAQRREKCLFRNQIVENRPEPLHDLAPRVLEPRSSSNFPLSRNFDPSPFVNPPSHRSIPLLIYIYIYRRSSNEATTRRGGRSPPSPPFQLSFRGIESPPNRFPARENCGRNIGNFEICSLPPKLLVYPSRERLRTDGNATGSGFGRLISFLE